MKTPIVNRKCLVLISILLAIGTRGISYGQAADASIQIWSGTVTSGTWGNAFGNGNATGYGYSSSPGYNAGSISQRTFTYRGTSYTIHGIGYAQIGNNLSKKYVLTISPGFSSCDKQRLSLDGLGVKLADAGVGGSP